MTKSILIIEDDALVRESLYEVLNLEGYRVSMAADGRDGRAFLEKQTVDVVLADLRLPDCSGLDLLKTCAENYPSIDVLIMTSFATVETAVEAMKFGAADYLVKPIHDDEIKILLKRIFEMRELKEENVHLKEELSEKRSHFHDLIGADAKMQRIYQIIRAIQDTDTTVLLKGESGTGKGMIAQAIHYSDPARNQKAFVEVSCGAIPRELLESELFGHVKGAFTSAIRDRIGRFEAADGGTVLLDEIDALPPYLQVKLLRVLQQKSFERVGDTQSMHVDVRIIAATNRNLEEEIRKGNFREDLYYRLNVITIEVPALRERRGDIPNLIEHFLKQFNAKMPRKIRGVSKEAVKVMMEYDWPGNVRELENLLERACVLSQGDILTVESFPENLLKKAAVNLASNGSPLKEVLREPEKRVIVEALEQSGWNRKKAASMLNINRTTLYNKMRKHNLL
ncbi:MAG: sigma-54 dependent transcriptional regulator [Candidatus Omnitrophica bacterium]|nr:sigma-54 dependent transcriptional regulator [Candidatus Omnitrophota bacterium]MDD5670890.1 sigma-54 dependent transcriptional regulator [Candidatus Omnitrophota bacterium]